jgi:choline dehydrogenase-like flavoprotein
VIIDARSVQDGIEVDADVCIVGGGAAGISLARSMDQSGLRVVLLESGNTQPDQATQNLYAGQDIGRPYSMFNTSRFRFLGGTTNMWGGAWCDLPSDLDFEERDGVPMSGWPLSMEELAPWYHRAQPVLRLGPFAYALDDWGIDPAEVPAPFRGPHLQCRVLQQAPTTRFGKYYRAELQKSKNISTYLNANVLEIGTEAGGKVVRHVLVGTLSGVRFTVRAKQFVLACGGIENARLLLLSGGEGSPGIGNEHDLVGRFFMLHMEYTGPSIVLNDPFIDLAFQTGENGAIHRRRGKSHRFVSYIALSDKTKRQQNLPAVRFRFVYPRSPEMDVLWRVYHRKGTKKELMRDVVRVARRSPDLALYILRRIIHGRNKPHKPLPEVALKCTAEQLPNRDSRIGLGAESDAFGLRRVTVDWRLADEDLRGIETANRLLEEELVRSGFGTVKHVIAKDADGWPVDLRGDQHHMGTTRMHRDPKYGVVDENCRVHGVENLYVAGSSVFPTSGTFNPTLTIVALALRLSQHIQSKIRVSACLRE